MFGNNNIHRNEEKALLAIVRMQSTSSSRPTTRIGWDTPSAVPYCEWEGVKCGGSGGVGDSMSTDSSIVELNLSNAGLRGTLPSELGLLANLEYLSFAGNMLRGTIPTQLSSQLTKLITLNLTGCYLTGILPQTFASTQLVSLLLANNAISGRFFHTADSPHLTSIREIRMEDNLLTGTLHGPTVARMTNLVSLSLSNNDISGLLPASSLGSMSTLKYVYLDSNSFVGPLSSSLAATTQQQTSGAATASILELWLQDNLLSGTVPASYAHFDKMHSFYIDGNKLTGELPQDLCGPEINVDFFKDAPAEAERNYCDSIACPAGSVALEGVYPCSRCPGGEAARLHNRYLGQTGDCVNYTDRDVLQLFHIATTKGGPWNGVNDWNDMTKSVCEMTGIGCDVHDRVTSINLKGRGLEGHIPKEIGSLTNLEAFDVSDNLLMGYVPSDIRWTSITSLDISGNRIRGLIPPLLCMIDGLNGNGQDGAFYCDHIACPSGTYNSIGRLDYGGGEACMPCIRHTSPFIGQKTCTKMFHGSSSSSSNIGGHPLPVFVRETVRRAGETTWALAVMITTVALIIAMVLSCVIRRSEKYWRSRYEVGVNNEDKAMILHSSKPGDDDNDEYKNRKQGRMAGRSTVYREYTIARVEEDLEAENNYHDNNYDDEDDDDNTSHTSGHSCAHSATELINDHQGISLRKGERILRTVASRVAVGDMGIGRRAREAASTINVSARRLTHSRSNVEETSTEPSGAPWSDDSDNETLDYYDGRTDFVSTSPSSSTTITPSKRKTKVYQSSDLLDIPMVT